MRQWPAHRWYVTLRLSSRLCPEKFVEGKQGARKQIIFSKEFMNRVVNTPDGNNVALEQYRPDGAQAACVSCWQRIHPVG